MQSKVYL